MPDQQMDIIVSGLIAARSDIRSPHPPYLTLYTGAVGLGPDIRDISLSSTCIHLVKVHTISPLLRRGVTGSSPIFGSVVTELFFPDPPL